MNLGPANSRPLTVWLAAALALCSGCQLALGGETTSGRVVGSGELTDQVSLQLEPGALRSPEDNPVAWLSTPTAEVTLTASSSPPPDLNFVVANVAPDAAVNVREVRGVASTEDPACDSSNNPVDCEQSDDPRCDLGSYTSETPTRGTVSMSLPACTAVTFQLAPDTFFNPQRGATIAFAGRTETANLLANAAEAADSAGADLLVLLGDHTEAQSDSPIDRLTSETTGLELPVVTLAGERERIDDSLTDFERQFGPVDIAWSVGGVDVVAPDSSSGGLGREGVAELRDQLRPFGRDSTLLIVTHRPPLDPDGFRDRGFTSRIEGARMVSLIDEFQANAIVAGHLATSTRDDFAGIPLHVIASQPRQRILLTDIPPDNANLTRSWVSY